MHTDVIAQWKAKLRLHLFTDSVYIELHTAAHQYVHSLEHYNNSRYIIGRINSLVN